MDMHTYGADGSSRSAYAEDFDYSYDPGTGEILKYDVVDGSDRKSSNMTKEQKEER